MKFENINYGEEVTKSNVIVAEEEIEEKSDDKIYWSDVKPFLNKHKLVVWTLSIIPLGLIIGDSLGSGVLLFVTILQMLAFATMCWIGWGGIAEKIRNLFN